MNPGEFHRKSEDAREKDNHQEALDLIAQAILGYETKADFKGLSKAYQSRVLIYKHLFLLTKDKKYLDLAKKDALRSLEIARVHELSEVLGSCYFRIGEIDMLAEDFESAIRTYEKSLGNYSGSNAEKGDYRYHLGEAVYKKGDKSRGKKLMFQGLSEIQQNRSEVDAFLVHVWESGAYMRLAECLYEDEPEETKKYLKKAKDIIDSDEKLVIRKRQWEELSRGFN